MRLNDVEFGCELTDVIAELQSQLAANHINLIQKTIDTPDNIMVCCPYHKGGQERRPSAGIQKQTGIFHCFGCGEVHSLEEVISDCFGHHDDMGRFGWNWLLKNFLTIAVEERKPLELNLKRDRISVCSKQYVSEEELDKYRYTHPYMYKRGLTDEIIEKFDIGYDIDTQCITFPNRDINGNTLFVARRSVNTKFFNYPSKVEKPVYGLYELSKLKTFPTEIIICESMLDALKVWTFGKYAVALNGLGTKQQFEQLNKLYCRKFILATDKDEAGQRARKVIRSNIKNKIVTEFDVSSYPEHAKDMNDMSITEFKALREVF